MSRGSGGVERRIAELFAATRDRGLTIDQITDCAFGLAGKPPTRAQRLSATRAAHRLLRRVRDAHARMRSLTDEAHDRVRAALGWTEGDGIDNTYRQRLEADLGFAEANKLHEFCNRIGIWTRLMRGDRPGSIRLESDFWCTATVNGRLYFHPPDAPVRVWAVSIGPGGITWAQAKVVRITAKNVLVSYAGELARLDRDRLWLGWAFWRGVRFVSSRTGRIAAELDAIWRKRYGDAAGGVPPGLQMPLAEAIALLGVPADYTRADVLAAFRRQAKKAHPDTETQFRKLVEARDRLLTALGTSAPPPKTPTYAPKGSRVIYRRVRAGSPRLGSTTRLLG